MAITINEHIGKIRILNNENELLESLIYNSYNIPVNPEYDPSKGKLYSTISSDWLQ